MKNKFSLVVLLTFFLGSVSGQYEQWTLQGYSIGTNQTGGAYCAMGAMPDIANIDGTYFMYYVAKYGTQNAIWYATSPDMINWTVEDTIMTASTDPANRIYDLGGPGLLKLNDGTYRLYYRTSQAVTFPDQPLFHIRSMTSSDGINFVHEGIRVECQPYQPDSYFLSASHPAIYRDDAGDIRAFITGRDSTMSLSDPARLYIASSPDEGLTFENFVPVHNGCHDPVVIMDSLGTYHMYVSYFGSGYREMTSPDGITWPAQLDTMYIYESGSLITEDSSPNSIADLGSGVLPNGAIMLFSNYKTAPGAWTNIAYYIFGGYSELEVDESNGIAVYPNPASEFLNIVLDENGPAVIQIYSIQGELISTDNLHPGVNYISTDKFASGQYIGMIQNETEAKTINFIVTHK